MAERFADRNAAGLKFAGNVILAQLLAFVKTPGKNLFAKAVGDRGS